MLVVTANWGIADGTLTRPAVGWQPGLLAALRRAVARAGFRRDGSYRPIPGVDVVVAGDAFDWLVSSEWCGRRRPWHGGAATEEIVQRVALHSLRSGRRLLGQLARWTRQGLDVPAPDHRGRPSVTTARVAVRVTMLAGDRDEPLAAVAGPARLPFAIGETWGDGRLTIRHGHDLDPACHRSDARPGPRFAERPPTLAESVAVDLVAAFGIVARDAIGPAAMRLVRSLAAVRPVEIPPAFARWRRSHDPAGEPLPAGGELDAAWRRCVDHWVVAARRSVPSCEAEFDVVDALTGWLASATEGEASQGVPPVLARLAICHPPTPHTVSAHAWRPADEQGPPVVAVEAGADDVRTTMLDGREPAEPVVAIGTPGFSRVRGGTIIDAA